MNSAGIAAMYTPGTLDYFSENLLCLHKLQALYAFVGSEIDAFGEAIAGAIANVSS